MSNNIEQQLKSPSQIFAACACGDDSERCARCLRRTVWEMCELPSLTVLRRGECLPASLHTYMRKYGIPCLRDKLTRSAYSGFIREVLRHMSRATYYRYMQQKSKPSVEAARAIEQAWDKYSSVPFPWEHEEEMVDWLSSTQSP